MGNKTVKTLETPEISAEGRCSFIFPANSRLLSGVWVAFPFALAPCVTAYMAGPGAVRTKR